MRWWRHGVCVEQRHAHLSGCGDPAQSKSASPRDPMPDLPGNSRYFLQISNACYRVCFRGGDMLVSVFFFIKIYEACPLLNTPLLQLPSRISRIRINKRVFSPLLALVSLLRQGVVTCAAYFPFCFDTAVKVFLSFEIDIAIVYSIEQYRYG